MNTNYKGPYSVEEVSGKRCTLKKPNGDVLKVSVSVDNVKIYNQPKEMDVEEYADYIEENTNVMDVEDYVNSLHAG